MDTIKCVIKRIVFENTENGFMVLSVFIGKSKIPASVVGIFAGISIGSYISAEGEWVNNKRFGRQFEVSNWEETLPTDLVGLKKYLGGGLIKGVGPKLASRIVDYFGFDVVSVLDDTPERLKEVYNIGKKRIEVIHNSWVEKRESRRVMSFLRGHDISPGFTTKIYNHYGNNSISIIQSNPYRLCRDIHGIGFVMADKLALSLGFSHEHPFRCKNGIIYALSVLNEKGHVYCPLDKLANEASALLHVSETILQKTILEMISSGALCCENNKVYSPEMLAAESYVSQRLASLVSQKNYKGISVEEAYEVGKALGITYDKKQAEALSCASHTKVMVLTGGPGTGKTTIVQGILHMMKRAGKHILLAAPTGRAAKRMTEATGHEAKTIHRMLEYNPVNGCQRDRTNPLDGDVLIVDECSMIDIWLMYNLLDAIPDKMTVIFVGDVDQLPSVGPGNVLRDIIDSGVCPVVRLEHIFRQAMESKIIVNAHQINQGKMIVVDNQITSDFFFMKEDKKEPGDVAECIVDLVCRRLPATFKVSPSDIQVLSPMKRGAAGTLSLNLMLQEALNPGKGGLKRNGNTYRKGDKVMQLKNNYDNEVFNGDIGYITEVNEVDKTLTVQFEDNTVLYEEGDLDQLTHAYALTIHKSQGSEYKIVVIPLLTSHYMMLQRNLLYTAITRAKQMVVLMADMKALSLAIHNNSVEKRYTYLTERLRADGLVAGKTA